MNTCGGIGSRYTRAELDLAFEVADHRGADVDVVELVDVRDAAGREDVDLEDLVAHQIDADEVEAVGHQARAQQIADAPLGLREVGAPPRAADVHVVADVVLRAHALVRRDGRVRPRSGAPPSSSTRLSPFAAADRYSCTMT